MPDQPTASPPVIETAGSTSPRLQLEPGVPTTSHVDGGSWPRSSSLPVELPPLLTSLAPILGHVASVGYHLNGWDQAPGFVDTGDAKVLLQGFTADDPHSVVIVSTSGRRLTLLVSAADSTVLDAQQALSRAAQPGAGVEGDLEAEEATDRAVAEVALRLSLLKGDTSNAHRATVTQWVNDAAQQFTHAPIQSYVPILVEHIVRERHRDRRTGRMSPHSPGRQQ